jgi:hypothetical protein
MTGKERQQRLFASRKKNWFLRIDVTEYSWGYLSKPGCFKLIASREEYVLLNIDRAKLKM